MKRFRKKVFKEVLMPVATVAGVGVGTANLVTNRARAKQEKKFQDSQVAATERLVDALEKESKLHETKLASRDLRRKIYKNTSNSTYIYNINNRGYKKFRKKNS